jgi:hypothetical protein
MDWAVQIFRGKRIRMLVSPPLAITLTACAVVLFLRRPESILNPQFWAEDMHFFERAYVLGGLPALFLPYSGYFHFVPRLVAAIAVHLDPAWAPGFFEASAIALTLYVAARTQSPRSPLPHIAACAFAVVLVPDAFEVLHNITNIQWVLAGGLALLLVSTDPTNFRQQCHDAVAATALSLTGPFSLIMSPAFILRAVVRRSRWSIALAAIVTVCGALQGWEILHFQEPPQSGQIMPEAMLAVPGLRIFGSLFLGVFVPVSYTQKAQLICAALLVAGVAILSLRKGPAKPERIWLAGALLLLLAASLFRCRHYLPELSHTRFGERYFFHLQLICLWLLLWSFDDPRVWIRSLTAGLFLWSLACNIPRLREAPLVDYHWADYVSRIRNGEAVTVPVNPPGWEMPLPARKTTN